MSGRMGRMDKCCRCQGKGYWIGGADLCIEYKCDPCPAPKPEYTKEGWLIVDNIWGKK